MPKQPNADFGRPSGAPSAAGPRARAQARRTSQESRFPQIRIPPERSGAFLSPHFGRSGTWLFNLGLKSRTFLKSGTYTSSPSGLPRRRPRALLAQQGRQHAGHGSARLTGGTFTTAPHRHRGVGGARPHPSAVELRAPPGGRRASSASPTFSPRWRQGVRRRPPFNCTHAYRPTKPLRGPLCFPPAERSRARLDCLFFSWS